MTREPKHEIISMLDLDQYERLLRFFDVFPNDAKIQKNHYFGDEEGVLERNNFTLRIREKSSKFQIDFKVPLSKNDGEMLEISNEIEHEYFKLLKKNEKSFPKEIEETLGKLAIERVVYLGDAITKRVTIPCTAIEGSWMLDVSEYPVGKTDYRLELEYDKKFKNEAMKIFQKKLEENGIDFIKPPSKFKVFMQQLQEHRKIIEENQRDIQKARKQP